MSRYVRMITSLNHPRYDDRHWRDFPTGSLIEVPDWEADLIVGNIAVEVEPEELPAPVPPPVPAAEPASHWAPNGELLPETPVPAAEVPEVHGEITGETAADSGPPRPGAAKQIWIDYAVSQGADPNEASALTKEQLQAQYGGRL